jgi:SIR2-like domain/OST-HTH/LOTUS domain
MSIDLHTKEALLNATAVAKLPIAFLVGSPLSIDVHGGVPGVGPMLDLVRAEIRAKRPTAMDAFEAAINGKTGGDAYQAAMKWLQGNLLQEAVNHVVEEAVVRARKAGASKPFECDGEACDWLIPEGTRQLAELVCRQPRRFPGPILTTNFDPLLSLAIYAAGGRAKLRVIQADGRLNPDVRHLGDCEIVHLHGYWRGSDTLHTPVQLTNPREQLKSSIVQLLKKKTLVVVAYGGWDDVFAKALAQALSEDDYEGSVLWCFRESKTTDLEANYKHLFDRVAPAITRGRFLCYGGIDCHSIFAEIGGLSPAAPAAPVSSVSPLAGWDRIDSTYLSALTPLRADEVIKYFDGAIPTWRHAASPAIPRRQVLSEVITRLATFQPGMEGCSLQLIRAAGGEGKTTLLLQAATDAIRSGGWTVLWRPSPRVGLPPEHIVNLDASKQWLIVADDAENLVDDLSESARLLHEVGRSNVHFLLASRDADWWARFGDKPPWETWLKAWVRRNRAIMLRGINRDDAKAVVEAWTKYGAEGLRELGTFSGLDDRVNALLDRVQDAVDEQDAQMERRTPIEGSFFGGLLTVRFGQNGLQAHVRVFLNRLKDDPIENSSLTLFDALVYVAACHAVGIPGLDENVLADLVGVPREWVQTLVVRPLGEEAAAVQSAGHVLTRHSKVAAAILMEADQTLDLAEVWSAIVRQTVRTGRDIRVGYCFPMIVHAGPRLLDALPKQLSEKRRTEIAIGAAKASVKYESDWLGCVVNLGKTYRKAENYSEAVKVFRDNLETVHDKVDFSDHIRGYWYEWGVSEGSSGNDGSAAWLQGLSLSDHLKTAPVTNDDAKLVCAGLGVAFGKLAQPQPSCPFAVGRRAVAYLGRFTNPDQTATRYFDTHDREADKIGTSHPKDNDEAIAWLTTAVAQAGRELQDPFLNALLKPEHVSFNKLRQFFTSATPTAPDYVEKVIAVAPTQPAKIEVETRRAALPAASADRLASSRDPANQTTEGGDLRSEVHTVITDLIDSSSSQQRPLLLTAVGKELGARFPKAKPMHHTLGYDTLTNLVLSFDDFTVTGEHPTWLVQYRESGLRYQIWTVINDLIDRSIFQQRPLLLTAVGKELGARFPEAKPVHHSLGYDTLTELILSFDDFTVTGEHPKWLVQYREDRQTTGGGDLRSEVGILIGELIDRSISEQRPLYLPTVGLALGARFPEAKPVHRSLGFDTLTDLILSFDDFTVTGEHPRWKVHYREAQPTTSGEDLRYEVGMVVTDLIDRSMSEQRPLYLPTVGFALAERFPEARPIQRTLGFATLTDLLQSFRDFTVTGEHPRWLVHYRDVSSSSPDITQLHGTP